jgi:hypothetical protein
MTKILLATVTAVAFAATAQAQQAPRITGPDICRGHLWIHHLASIQSSSNSSDDPMSCYFDLGSPVGKRVLRVCNEYGGDARHGCWIKGRFVVDRDGDRRLIRVIQAQKIDDEATEKE